MTTPSSGRRDCRCKRARHKHGTEGAYTKDGCRCFACRLARSEYMRARSSGREHPAPLLMDGTGTRRRIRALYALGWTGSVIARELGVTVGALFDLRVREGRPVYAYTAERMAVVYDRLSATIPPENVYARRARALAQRNGYVPPLAWDDDEIDNPDARPRGIRPEPSDALDDVLVQRYLTGRAVAPKGCNPSPELLAAVAQLHARGLPDSDVGQRVGMNRDAVTALRLRHGIRRDVSA